MSEHEWDLLKWPGIGFRCYRYEGVPLALKGRQFSVTYHGTRAWLAKVSQKERDRLASGRRNMVAALRSFEMVKAMKL